MINLTKPSNLLALALVLTTMVVLSGCATQQKNWNNYNKQIGLLSADDKALFLASLQYALEKAQTNTQVPWENAEGSVSGEVKPIATFKLNSGKFCRVYQASFSSDSEDIQETEATACRNSEGIWDPISPSEMHI